MDETEGRGKGCFTFLGRGQIRKVVERWDNRSMMAKSKELEEEINGRWKGSRNPAVIDVNREKRDTFITVRWKLSLKGKLKGPKEVHDRQIRHLHRQRRGRTKSGERKGGRRPLAIVETLRLTVKFASGLCV